VASSPIDSPTSTAELRSEREERRRRLEAVLDAKLEALADAFDRECV
jgi:hypothetical protein